LSASIKLGERIADVGLVEIFSEIAPRVGKGGREGKEEERVGFGGVCNRLISSRDAK